MSSPENKGFVKYVVTYISKYIFDKRGPRNPCFLGISGELIWSIDSFS